MADEVSAMTSGGCLCGSVRYQIDEAPLTTRICWCRLCQKIGSGSVTVNVCFPTASLRSEGLTTDYVSVADSGNVMHRRFCAACGVHLYSEAECRPHLIFVRAGTLDDTAVVRPQATIWICEAPSWASIDQSLPRFARQPPPAA